MGAGFVRMAAAAVERRWRVAGPRTARGARSLGAGESDLLARLETRISHRDAMYGGDPRRYFAVGLSALRCVDEALDAAGSPAVRRVLDLPCGHGRVLRWLAARFPGAALTAGDVDADGVQWCARRLGATPAYSVADFDGLHLGQRFDLIWCGSLVTHLDEAAIAALLRLFARHLDTGGVAVVSTHGERAAEHMRAGRLDYLLEPAAMRRLLADHVDHGFGYADYPDHRGYGVSLAAREWVVDRAARSGLREVSFHPAGWDAHQDVIGLVA